MEHRSLNERENDLDLQHSVDVLNLLNERLPLMEKDLNEVVKFKIDYDLKTSEWKMKKDAIREEREAFIRYFRYFMYACMFGIGGSMLWLLLIFLL